MVGRTEQCAVVITENRLSLDVCMLRFASGRIVVEIRPVGAEHG
jgi:hypothetical protein